MTSERAWDDFLLAAQGGEPDRVPVALSADGAFLASALGMNVLDFYMYPDRWLNAYVTLLARFPEAIFVPGFWVEYGMANEPSAFGTSVFWRQDQAPAIRPLNLPLDAWCDLPRPDPFADGLMALVVRRYWNLEHGELPEPYRVRFVAARGPFTIASHVLGANPFLAALSNPDAYDMVYDALTIFTDTTIRFLQAQLSCLRDPMGIVIMDDTVGMISPRTYERFAKPALDRIFRAFDGLIRIFRTDTPCEHLLPYLPHLDFEVFHFSHMMDIHTVKAVMAPKAVMGNVSPLLTLVYGTPPEVEAAARNCIEQASAGGGLILAPGGGTHINTPAANIDALIRAGRE